jgi:cysteine desulfurase/selenocysteine lyase
VTGSSFADCGPPDRRKGSGRRNQSPIFPQIADPGIHEKLFVIPGLRIIGTADQKITVVSFVFDDIFHFDIGQLLDARGIAVRTGHHCTQPLMGIFGIEGTVRASFSVYNTKEEIDRLVEGLDRIVKMMK